LVTFNYNRRAKKSKETNQFTLVGLYTPSSGTYNVERGLRTIYVFIIKEEPWMLIGLMKVIGIFYLWTWFLWPFIFVISLIHAITSAVKDENASSASSIVAGISLLIILAGVISPNFF
jgi:hypothetical protein